MADMKLDVASVVTGLLHDTVEDTEASLEQVAARRSPAASVLLLDHT